MSPFIVLHSRQGEIVSFPVDSVDFILPFEGSDKEMHSMVFIKSKDMHLIINESPKEIASIINQLYASLNNVTDLSTLKLLGCNE